MNNEKEREYNCSGAIDAMKNTYLPLEIEVPDLHRVEKFGASKVGSSPKSNFHTESDQPNIQSQGRKQTNNKQW